MDQVVRVTAECAAAIESGVHQQQQQAPQQPPAAATGGAANRGLRGLTSALAGRFAGVNIKRTSPPQPDVS